MAGGDSLRAVRSDSRAQHDGFHCAIAGGRIARASQLQRDRGWTVP